MMKKLFLSLIALSLCLGVWAEDDARVTVILEDNLIQQGGKRLADTPPPYEGDPQLANAFKTVQVRMQTMLVSSGRVDVKPKTAIGKVLTEGNIFLCSYTLVQGKLTDVKRGRKQEYILGINLQAFDYVTEKPLTQLNRTVDLKLFEDSTENALAYVARYLAVITLEALSPVKILEKDGKTVSVNAGGELLKVGDVLSIRKGLKKAADVRVVETDSTQSICEIVSGDETLIEIGAKCRFVLPDNLSSDTTSAKAKSAYVPTVVVKEVKSAVEDCSLSTFVVKEKVTNMNTAGKLLGSAFALSGKRKAEGLVELGAGVAPKTYEVERVTMKRKRADIVDIPKLLLAKLKTQNTGLKMLSFDGMSQQEIEAQGRSSDYELTCEIIGYAEEHTNGRYENDQLTFDQNGTVTANVTLVNTESKEVVGGHAFPITAVSIRANVSVHGLDSAGTLLAWDTILTECVNQISVKIRESAAMVKN